MGMPQRTDRPQKITLSLSAECHRQLHDLSQRLTAGRRSVVSRSEVVERAVAAYHASREAAGRDGAG